MRKHAFFVVVLAALVALADAASAASVGRCGGDGGGNSANLSCPAGQYVVALSAKGGDYLDRLGVKCAPFNAAGRRGAVGHTATSGGTGGSESASSTCSGDAAVASILTYSGTWIDTLSSALCAKRKPAGGFEGKKFESRLEFGIGGTHGAQCSLSCPTGQAVHKIAIRYGAWIDSIEVFCRP